MRKLILVAALFAPTAAHARTPSPYRTLSNPVYTCVAGDNSVAINGLLANGGVVQIAAGTCHLTGGLMMTVSGTTLTGAGEGVTILKASQPNTIDVVTVGNAAANYHGNGFMISNLTVSGDLLTTAPVNPTTGRGIVVNGGVYGDLGQTLGSGLTISGVESHAAVDGIVVHGADVLVTGSNIHNNRHAGLFAEGIASVTANPIARYITLQSSSAVNNNLDNQVGSTWDDVDISKYTASITIGGATAALGNTITNGDILLGCPPTDSKCVNPTGPFTVQNNTVNNLSETVQGVGIRTYGNVTDALIDSNTVTTQSNAIGIFGNTTDSTVSNNTVSQSTAAGITVQPLGSAIGDHITVQSNAVTMGDKNKPAFQVDMDTNVSLIDNNAEGEPNPPAYDTANAGSGLVMEGNK